MSRDDEPLDRLQIFLEAEAFPGATGLRIRERARPTGGASWETFLLTLDFERDGAPVTERVAIKRAPATGPLAPYLVTKDVAIFTELAKSEVPVPRLLAWTEDPEVFERPFTATGFVSGDTHDITKVEQWEVWQRERDALGFEIIDTLAALQRVKWRGTALEEALGPSGDARARACRLVDRYLDPLLASARAARAGVPLWRDLGAWLKANAPDLPEDELVVVHGDYRFGNYIWQGTKIAAVVDWERATLGPPMQDLAFICMPLSRRKDPSVMGKALPFDALAARYEQASGRSVDSATLQYYMVLWQFIEGVNGTRGLLRAGSAGQVGTGGVAMPNLVARQTLALMEDIDAGRCLL